MQTTKRILLGLILATVVGFSVGIPLETAQQLPDTQARVVYVEEAESGLDNVWKLSATTTTRGWTGTAFPIACEPSGSFWKITLLTAGHCVDPDDPNLVFGAEHDDGRYLMYGRTLVQHPDIDVGLVTFVSFFAVDVREFDFSVLQFGDEVLVAGYPIGEGPYLTEGRFSGSGRISASGYPGSSGSPVSNEAGDVVGILVAGYGDWTPIDFMVVMVPISEIEEWVRLWL